jgi:hypothetical protein
MNACVKFFRSAAIVGIGIPDGAGLSAIATEGLPSRIRPHAAAANHAIAAPRLIRGIQASPARLRLLRDLNTGA